MTIFRVCFHTTYGTEYPLILYSGCTYSIIKHLTVSICGAEEEGARSGTVNSICFQSQVSKIYVRQLSDGEVIDCTFMAHGKVII